MIDNRAQYKKEWYLKNKDRLLEKNKAYRDTHKDEEKEYNKKRYEATKDGYHNVYLLTSHNYVGVTSNLPHRLRQHKTKGRDSKNYVVLYKTEIRDEAHQIESVLHNMGYEGKHSYNSYK
jgi:predicted GIY-YIG superfamily endonuclease